jgi:phosphate transport system substrate-binding protein
MKKIFSALLLIITSVIHAQSTTSTVIKITGTKFPFTIMEQWINVYNKTHLGIKFELSKSIPADSADLMIAAHAFRAGELKTDETIVALNRYAQLPIVNSNRPDLAALQQKGFKQSDLATIFFSEEQNKTDGLNSPVTIYKRDKNVCATRSFTESIIGKQATMYGTSVTGDDRALSVAVKNDLTGISYNNLGLVYNITTRKVADSIAIIPIDLNENGTIDNNENNYATLDNLLDFIDKTNNNKIPQEYVNVVFNKKKINKNTLAFLQWIITEGQQYNRQFGFLNLDASVVLQQRHLLDVYLNAKK